MAVLIASSVALVNSLDFSTAKGSITLYLFDAAGPSVPTTSIALIQIKADNGEYITVGQIDGTTPAKVLEASGVYRVSKQADTVAFGVGRD